MDTKIPYIDVDEMREQIVEYYDAHAQPDVLFAILTSIDELQGILEEVETGMFEHRDSEKFEQWREGLAKFDKRMQWYADASEGASDPVEAYDVIGPPFFEGEYPEDFEDPPKSSDVDTIWDFANELVVIGDPRDVNQASLEEMRQHYEKFVEAFWEGVATELKERISVTDVVPEGIQAAADAADKLAEEQPEDVVSVRVKGANEGRRSMAPLLLAAGAILLMAQRNKRRR